jgi:hypothetical protein
MAEWSGARSPLDYARYRLPAIRRLYTGSEQLQSRDDAPALTRGAMFDQKLTALMSSVSTAFDEYRSLASEEEDEFRAEAGIVPKRARWTGPSRLSATLYPRSQARAPRRLHALAGDDQRRQGSEAARHPDR